jgi:iron complex outermembrane recepter protein
MKITLLLIPALTSWLLSVEQGPLSSPIRDSTAPQKLDEVIVRAYEQNRRLIEVPAAIGLAGQPLLNRFSNTGILPALNTIPGVRMEERSPGSYRLNIRGSSLRSPFGVRDVKIYYNEIPLTDPTGNTYLNGLGFYNFQSMEVIKGPAGSLYGAAIGGALLIRTLPQDGRPGAELDYSAGSYAANLINANVSWGNKDQQNYVDYNHQSSNGYRVQTQSRRDIVSWETQLKASEKQILHAYMYYSDLYYQTPGGLNITEYNKDPRQARPPVGTTPGAVQAQAAIFQKTFVGGFSNEYHISEHWQNTTALYGSYTDFKNPGVRVYEIRKEPHFGARSVFQYKTAIKSTELQIHFGAEAQKGFFSTADYANNLGTPGVQQTNEQISNWQYMIFAQADLKFRHGWILTAGASLNKSSIAFSNLTPVPPISQTRVFENKIAPRIALLKRITPDISLYASAAKGFSPPTVSELLTSSGVIGYNLQPENGIDYEAGVRGDLFGQKLHFDINCFFFQIQQAIVQRIDTNNVYYYVNAGSTRQNGLETYVSYQFIDRPDHFIRNLKTWISDTWNDFHYHSFVDVNSQSTVVVDYSGKQLPGVPPQTIVAGLDLGTAIGLYTNITYTYSDRIALNDANTAYAGSYNLLGARLGYRKACKDKIKWELFGGVDNIFNIKYSLGNDFNAANGRYYNAAPGINYYAGISIHPWFR